MCPCPALNLNQGFPVPTEAVHDKSSQERCKVWLMRLAIIKCIWNHLVVLKGKQRTPKNISRSVSQTDGCSSLLDNTLNGLAYTLILFVR